MRDDNGSDITRDRDSRERARRTHSDRREEQGEV